MTKFDLTSLIRPNILNVAPYRCARDDFDQGILLDANENSFGAPIKNSLSLHRYPDPRQIELRNAISELKECKVDNIFLGVGSDEAIDLLIRLFCVPGKDSILVTPPTYGMYSVAAQINDVAVIKSPLNADFELNANETMEAIQENTKIIFLCSPNNPTGNTLNPVAITDILHQFKGIVVIDEAYIDFSESPSFIRQLDSFPNLVVLQTFSKAYGLAGARVGMAFASDEIINYLLKIKPPYNLNSLSLDIAIHSLKRFDFITNVISEIKTERELLIENLKSITPVQKVFSSQSNYVLFRMKDAHKFYLEAANNGVVARYRGNEIHCDDCIRVTVGTRAENTTFINTLKEWLSKNS